MQQAAPAVLQLFFQAFLLCYSQAPNFPAVLQSAANGTVVAHAVQTPWIVASIGSHGSVTPQHPVFAQGKNERQFHWLHSLDAHVRVTRRLCFFLLFFEAFFVCTTQATTVMPPSGHSSPLTHRVR